MAAARGGMNVLVTGTPGTGKSSLCSSIADELRDDGYRYVEVGAIVKEHGLHEGRDEVRRPWRARDSRRRRRPPPHAALARRRAQELDTLILDEDAMLDHLEPIVAAGGCVIDYHSCGLFPERWIQLVVVLRASTEALHDRLTRRGYSERKTRENIECEIFGVVEEEARESYEEGIVWVRRSDTVEEMEQTAAEVVRAVRLANRADGPPR